MSGQVESAPPTPEAERDWIFTFGHGHEHFGQFVRIRGTFTGARAVMFQFFGEKWCMQYESEEAAGVSTYGYRELELGQVVLHQFVIYHNPSDHPGKYVVRQWLVIRGDPEPHPVPLFTTHDTLENAREATPILEMGLVRLPRFDNDDPVIVEVWT